MTSEATRYEMIYIDDENFDRFIEVKSGASEVVTKDQYGNAYRYVDSAQRTEKGLRLFRFLAMESIVAS